ncbi:MAG: hypothetical protein GY861_22725 [bacterium]|nr:hypothetical protein [bacterium]
MKCFKYMIKIGLVICLLLLTASCSVGIDGVYDMEDNIGVVSGIRKNEKIEQNVSMAGDCEPKALTYTKNKRRHYHPDGLWHEFE